MKNKHPAKNNPHLTNQPSKEKALQSRLKTAEGSLSEIVNEIDALVISGPEGKKVFTLAGANYIYRQLMDQMSEGAITVTTEGIILYANKRFSEMLQIPLEKVLGSFLYNWFDLATQNKLHNFLQKAMVKKKHTQRFTLTASDEMKIPTLVSSNKVTIRELPTFLCLMITDLTEIKSKEALLDTAIQGRRALLSLIEDEREANSKYHLASKVFENSREGIIIIDAGNNIVLVNNAFTLITGYSESETLGNPIGKFIPDECRQDLSLKKEESSNLFGHWENKTWYTQKKRG